MDERAREKVEIQNWKDISYLLHGTPRQRQAYAALQNLRVMEILRAYSPVLVGTLPLDLDIAESDLDFLCAVYDHASFESQVRAAFAMQKNFALTRATINELPVVIAQFEFETFPFEIFGQPRPVAQQNGYRHLVVEARLLALGGDAARAAIRTLKRAGIKTEPAFARYFHLAGDPYQTLLELSNLSDAKLHQVVAGFPARREAD
ncbi:MAG: DUF4269 domain-containing protein [Chloroflexi bacterium]|nr:DUF4269 domain-containing protein [Chloroflexota bacterium]